MRPLYLSESLFDIVSLFVLARKLFVAQTGHSTAAAAALHHSRVEYKIPTHEISAGSAESSGRLINYQPSPHSSCRLKNLELHVLLIFCDFVCFAALER